MRRTFLTTIGALIIALGVLALPALQPGAAAEPPTLDQVESP